MRSAMTDRARQPELKLVGGRSVRQPGQPAPNALWDVQAPVVRSEHLGDHCLHCGAPLPPAIGWFYCVACMADDDGPEAA